jgi:ABC-2 type transport system ATP-binding protein
MDEAERLCDRVAVIDSGRVVATGSPATLAERVAAGQRVRFRPSKPLDDGLLTGLPEVMSLARRRGEVVVTGSGNVLAAIMSALGRAGVVAEHLRVDTPSLEDAVVALTGRAGERDAS